MCFDSNNSLQLFSFSKYLFESFLPTLSSRAKNLRRNNARYWAWLLVCPVCAHGLGPYLCTVLSMTVPRLAKVPRTAEFAHVYMDISVTEQSYLIPIMITRQFASFLKDFSKRSPFFVIHAIVELLNVCKFSIFFIYFHQCNFFFFFASHATYSILPFLCYKVWGYPACIIGYQAITSVS